MEKAQNSLRFRLKSILLALLAPELWGGQEIHLCLYTSSLLALLAPDLWTGQGIHFNLYISFLLAFIAPDLFRRRKIRLS